LVNKNNIFYNHSFLLFYYLYAIIVIKCRQTGHEVNSINDYMDIISTLASHLADTQVIDFLNKTWKYRDVNHDSSDSESDDEDENEKLFCGYSEDKLEAIIILLVIYIYIQIFK